MRKRWTRLKVRMRIQNYAQITLHKKRPFRLVVEIRMDTERDIFLNEEVASC